MFPRRNILSYSLLDYLDAPIIVMGVQQVPEHNKQRLKIYSLRQTNPQEISTT